jgi:hypothetical protein
MLTSEPLATKKQVIKPGASDSFPQGLRPAASPVVFSPKRATEFNNVTATKAIAFIPTFDFV